MADFLGGQIKTVQLFVCSSPNCPLSNFWPVWLTALAFFPPTQATLPIGGNGLSIGRKQPAARRH